MSKAMNIFQFIFKSGGVLLARHAGTDSAASQPHLNRVGDSILATVPMAGFDGELAGMKALDFLEECLCHIYDSTKACVYGFGSDLKPIYFRVRGPHCPYIDRVFLNKEIVGEDKRRIIIDLLNEEFFFYDDKLGVCTARKTLTPMSKYFLLNQRCNSDDAVQAPEKIVSVVYELCRAHGRVSVTSFEVFEEQLEQYCHVAPDEANGWIVAKVCLNVNMSAYRESFMNVYQTSKTFRHIIVSNPVARDLFFDADGRYNDYAIAIIYLSGHTFNSDVTNPEDKTVELLRDFLKRFEDKMNPVVEQHLPKVDTLRNTFNDVKQLVGTGQHVTIVKTLFKGIKDGNLEVIDVIPDMRGKLFAQRVEKLTLSDFAKLPKNKIYLDGEITAGRYVVHTDILSNFLEKLGE